MEQTTLQKSDSIVNLTKALMLFSVKIEKIKKTTTNPFFKSEYADLPTIQAAIAEPLQESGLVVLQIPDGESLITMISHAETGEYILASGLMRPVKNDPQSMGSAITYQRRYSIAAILNLNIDKDDDGNAASQLVPKTVEKATEKPWLNKFADQQKSILSKQWNDTILKIQGGTPLETVKQYFRLSKENEAELKKYIK